MSGLPRVTNDLIDYLEKLFPDQSPSLKDEEKKIWFKAGQVDVVRQLKNILEENSGNVPGIKTQNP